jgi:hypothetical protein
MMLGGAKKMGLKFSSRRTAPYQKIINGDIIYLKESSGPVRGRVRVGKVTNVEITDPEQIMQFLSEHSDAIGISNESQLMSVYLQNINRRYLCYWEMSNPEILQHPVLIRKNDRRAWVSGYEPSEEVLVGFLEIP